MKKKLSKWSQIKVDSLALNAEYNGMERSSTEEKDRCQRDMDYAKRNLEKRMLYLENRANSVKTMYSSNEVVKLIEELSSLYEMKGIMDFHNETGRGSGLSKSGQERVNEYFDIEEFNISKWAEDHLTKGKKNGN